MSIGVSGACPQLHMLSFLGPRAESLITLQHCGRSRCVGQRCAHTCRKERNGVWVLMSVEVSWGWLHCVWFSGRGRICMCMGVCVGSDVCPSRPCEWPAGQLWNTEYRLPAACSQAHTAPTLPGHDAYSLRSHCPPRQLSPHFKGSGCGRLWAIETSWSGATQKTGLVWIGIWSGASAGKLGHTWHQAQQKAVTAPRRAGLYWQHTQPADQSCSLSSSLLSKWLSLPFLLIRAMKNSDFLMLPQGCASLFREEFTGTSSLPQNHMEGNQARVSTYWALTAYLSDIYVT